MGAVIFPLPPTHFPLRCLYMSFVVCYSSPVPSVMGNPLPPSRPPPPSPQTATHTLFGCNFPGVFDEALTHHAESTSPLSDWSGGLGNCFIARHGRWVKKKIKKIKSIPDLNPDRNHSKPITISGQMPQHHHFCPPAIPLLPSPPLKTGGPIIPRPLPDPRCEPKVPGGGCGGANSGLQWVN